MDSPSRLLLSPDCENGYLIVVLYTITKTINGINTKNNEMIAPIPPSVDKKLMVTNIQPSIPKQMRHAGIGSRFFFG